MIIKCAAWAVFGALGIWAAWKDIRERRLSNQWLLAALTACAALYAALGLGIGRGDFGVLLDFFINAAVAGALGVIAALCLWRLGLWPAGDAKLFIVFSLLLSLINPNLRGFPGYVWLIMLVNIFVLAACFVLSLLVYEWIRMIFRLSTPDGQRDARGLIDRARKRFQDEWPRRGRYAVLAWNTCALFILCRLAMSWRQASPRGWESPAIFAGVYFGWQWLSRLLAKIEVAKISLAGLSLAALPFGYLWQRQFLCDVFNGMRQAAAYLVFLPIARACVDYYLEWTRRYQVSIEHVHPGLVLSRESWESVAPQATADQTQEPWRRYADGLSSDEAAWLRENPMRLGSGLVAYQVIPFAPWVFLGTLWTVLSRQTIVEVMMSFK